MDVGIPPPTVIPMPLQPIAPFNVNELFMPREQPPTRDSAEMPEEENLLLRRNEILSRLKEIDDKQLGDEIDDDLERFILLP